jgi:hypothetical protein
MERSIDEKIADLERQIGRHEAGTLRWTAVVGAFTIILAIIAGLQTYSFIESERALLIIGSVDFVGGEPTNASEGLDLVVTIKNVGKHTATIARMIAVPGLFVLNKELAQKPVYDPAHSIGEIIPPIAPNSDLAFVATANVPAPPAPMTSMQRIEGVISGDIPMRLWGFVDYDTGYISFRNGRVAFCYEYVPVSKRRIANRFRPCANPNYTYTH